MSALHLPAIDDAELLRQSALPLPALAREGIALFNRGEYFVQHEAFEHSWRAELGPVRALYQGVLQVGVAYLQITRGNHVGASKMFQRAWQRLDKLPDICQGIDIAQLRTDAQAAQTELARVGPAGMAGFDRSLLKPVIFAPRRPTSAEADVSLCQARGAG